MACSFARSLITTFSRRNAVSLLQKRSCALALSSHHIRYVCFTIDQCFPLCISCILHTFEVYINTQFIKCHKRNNTFRNIKITSKKLSCVIFRCL